MTMRLIDKLSTKDAIKKALEIEIENQYINIDGKKRNFSHLNFSSHNALQKKNIAYRIIIIYYSIQQSE